MSLLYYFGAITTKYMKEDILNDKLFVEPPNKVTKQELLQKLIDKSQSGSPFFKKLFDATQNLVTKIDSQEFY